jgi:hypothetical protein
VKAIAHFARGWIDEGDLRAEFCGSILRGAMGSRGFQRLGRWGIGALMVLTIHSLAMPRPAQASCGHLVSSSSERRLDLSQLDALIAGDSSDYAAQVQGQSPAHPRKRAPGPACSGPACSNSAPMPAPTSFREVDRFNQYGILASAELLGAGRPDWILDEPTPRPSGRPSAIFHPPRA